MSDRKLTISDRRLAALEQFERAQIVGAGDWKTIATMLAAAMPPPKLRAENLAEWADYKPAPGQAWHWRNVEVRFTAGRVVVAAKCIKGKPINWGYALRSAARKLLGRLSEELARAPGGGLNFAYCLKGGSASDMRTDHDGLLAEAGRIARAIDVGEVLSMRCDGIDVEVLPEIAPRKPAPAPKAKGKRK